MMRFLKNYQNNLKSRCCNHILIILEGKNGWILQKCIKCFRISESQEY